MFRTGLGKSVTVKQSSIAKALSVLGDDDFSAGGTQCSRSSFTFSNYNCLFFVDAIASTIILKRTIALMIMWKL